MESNSSVFERFTISAFNIPTEINKYIRPKTELNEVLNMQKRIKDNM